MTEYSGRHILPGDKPLRRNIRLLTWQFRRLVQEHGGSHLWGTLHQLRELAERRQQGDSVAESLIADLVATLPTSDLAEMTRAIGLFFDLSNLAEDRHRVRVLRQREEQGKQSETIRLGIAELRRGTTADEFKSVLSRLEVETVFTAHPTEAKRRTVRRVLRRLRRDLYLFDRPHLLTSERHNRLDRMRRDLLVLWSTDPVSARKPTVIEELRRTIYVVRTLWRIGPQLIQKLRSSLDSEDEQRLLKRPLQFGNWVGGDRDGNPFVTSDVTRSTLARLRAAAVRLHLRDCRRTGRRLSIASSRCPLPSSLRTRIETAIQRWPQLEKHIAQLHPHEWAVQWLKIIERRLIHSAELPISDRHPLAYQTAEELAEDISLIDSALDEAGLGELTTGALRRWRDRVWVFGLHLFRLDVRVNSTTVRECVDVLMRSSGRCDDYAQRDESGRRQALQSVDPRQAAQVEASAVPEAAADLLRVLMLAQQLAHAGNREAIGQFIVSMTQQPTDILGLAWLMKVAAFRSGLAKPVALEVVPLFETISDLRSAEDMLAALVGDASFRQHLKANNERLACMIGYSDSAKDGGYFASNWALYDAQRRLAKRAKAEGLQLTIFHGRGGALGRGGGPAARAILSLPKAAVGGKLRITEQGEVIADRYDDPAIAKRHLEQLFWATLRQSTPHDETVSNEDEELARTIAQRSMEAYRRLIESSFFEAYMRDCTALSLIERLPIGSRPSRRTGRARLEDLRAIPFTFAWNQTRMPINAFFGLGAAFESVGEAGQRHAADLYKRWPWFRAVIDNAELALARCDTAISRRYALRSADSDKAMAIWEQLRQEHDAARRAVLAIKDEGSIIERTPWLYRTIRVRNPYLDLLNLIQLELLSRRDRAGEEKETEALDQALRLNVQSIAAGLRNTG